LVLYALAAGTEAGPKLIQLAKGNAAFAVGLLAVLILITLLWVPLAISFVVPDAHVERGKLLLKLAAVAALPITLGLYLRARHETIANRLSAVMHHVSTTLLFVVFAQLIYVNFDEIVSLQSSALLAGLLLFAIAFAAGYVMGGPQLANRRALAIMTFARNGSIGMMIAAQVFAHEPKVLVMVTVMTTLSIVIGVLAVLAFAGSP
jgi:bile acid:Na+ symporter, BASS family